MTSYPLVSVVITSYNYAQFVGEAIESALAQTYPNLEVVVADDGSCDGSAEIIDGIASRDARVKWWVNERNLGAEANCNLALARSCGEYVTMLCADNFMLPGHIAAAIDYYQRHPECDLRSTGWLEIYDDSSRPSGYRRLESWSNIATHAPRRKLEDVFCFGDETLIETIVFPRRLLDRLGTFDQELYVNDVELLLRYADRGLTFAYDATPYIAFRYHSAGRGAPVNYVATGKQVRGWVQLHQRYMSDENLRRLVGRRKRVIHCFSNFLRALQRDNPQLYAETSERPDVKAVFARLEQIPDKLSGGGIAGPRLSVVLPTVGRAGLLLGSLESLAAQTLTSWEAIVVQNDGNDLEPLLRSLPYADRIVYARTLATGNAAAARNLGLRLALGESIAYLNEGDCWAPEHLTRVAAELDDLSVDVVQSAARAVFFSSDGGGTSQIDERFFPGPGEAFVDAFGLYTSLSTIVHRKHCTEGIGGFDEAMPLREDWEFLMRLLGVGWYRAVQLSGATVDVAYREMFRGHTVGERLPLVVPATQYVFRKHPSSNAEANARRERRIGEVAAAIGRLKPGEGLAKFAATVRELGGWPAGAGGPSRPGAAGG